MQKPILVAFALALVLFAGCDDSFGPNRRPVPEEPSEVTLSEFRGSDLRDASAFDVVTQRAVRTDQTPEWDFLFAVRSNGTTELRPRDAVLSGNASSGLQTVDRGFGQVREAPDGGYRTDSAVGVGEGDVLVVRSRQDPAIRTLGCSYFMKMEVLELDAESGTVTFRHLINPNCNQRNLVPGSSEED